MTVLLLIVQPISGDDSVTDTATSVDTADKVQ